MHVDDRTRLRHMLDAATDAVSFVGGKAETDVRGDKQLTLALFKCIEIVGEAASRVSAQFQAAHAEIPWADIIGMRNRLVHVYFDIDAALVFQTVRDELPLLIAALNTILREH